MYMPLTFPCQLYPLLQSGNYFTVVPIFPHITILKKHRYPLSMYYKYLQFLRKTNPLLRSIL